MLDIAGSNKVHYLCFSMPEFLPSKEMDAVLQQFLKDEAGVD
jgi:tRNA (guanine-N7-)-methyltransferase